MTALHVISFLLVVYVTYFVHIRLSVLIHEKLESPLTINVSQLVLHGACGVWLLFVFGIVFS